MTGNEQRQGGPFYSITPRSEGALNRTPASQYTERKLSKSRRLAISVGIATELGLSTAIGATGQYIADDPLFVPIYYLGKYFDKDCMNPSRSSIIAVDQALHAPDNETYRKVLLSVDKDSEKEYRRMQADKYGVTILDGDPYVLGLEQTTTQDEALLVLNSFTSNFGFKFMIPTAKEPRDSVTGGEQIIEYDLLEDLDLALSDLKLAAVGMIENLSRLPVEIGNLSNIHRILIVKNLSPIYKNPDPNSSESQIVAQTNSFNNSIYLDFNGFKNSAWKDLFLHELSHGIDGTVCGDFGKLKDVQYERINPPEFRYGDYSIEGEEYVLRSYGATSVAEDKAVTMEKMLTGLVNPYNLPIVVRAKYELQLARLEANVPGISGYLRSISVFNQHRRNS